MSASASEVLVIERSLAGVRLHDLLARNWPRADRLELRQLVASGKVSVNGEVCTSDRRLRVGDVVTVAEPPRERAGPRAARGADPHELHVLAETATALVVGGSSLVMLTWELKQYSAVLGLPMAFVYIVIPVSGVLICIYALAAIGDDNIGKPHEAVVGGE